MILNLKAFDQAQLLKITAHFADHPGTCLLYSGGQSDAAQTSYLALFPFETIVIRGRCASIHQKGYTRHESIKNPWDGLNLFFNSITFSNSSDYAFGFLGYEMGCFSDEDKELLYSPAPTPDAYWQRSALVVIVNHASRLATVIMQPQALPFLTPAERQWVSQLSDQQGWYDLLHRLSSKPSSFSGSTKLYPITAANRHAIYLEQIRKAQEWIHAGEIYQINLSQSFTFKGSGHPFSIFHQMVNLNPSPFSAYFKLKDFSIVSSSPERFLQKKGNRLETRPIKGTIHRGKTEQEDQALLEQLLTSPKEKAELLMITDLMRNDLGKISEVGTVKATKIWHCETYTNVFHLLSILHSQARADLSCIDIIKSCFPGGSITGCPKLRAMEFIQSLEQRPRGIYTGSIGYITGQGDFDLNIAIRTLLFMPPRAWLQLGAGIVVDSDPEKEYQETLSKGASFFQLFHPQGNSSREGGKG